MVVVLPSGMQHAQLVDQLSAMAGDAGVNRLLARLVRRLADGRPIPPSEAAALAGWPEAELHARLARLPMRVEIDEAGCIVGAGLTLRPTQHRFVLDDRSLYAWCALDTLIFPILLGRSARVESSCAATGRPITMTVTASGIEDLEPAGTVMSIVGLDQTCPDIRQSFCSHVSFFASADAARAWSEGRSGVHIISASGAFALATQIAPSFDAPDAKACCR